jgi:hypothetical protein
MPGASRPGARPARIQAGTARPVVRSGARKGDRGMKVILWIVGILVLIGLLVVVGFFKLIF